MDLNHDRAMRRDSVDDRRSTALIRKDMDVIHRENLYQQQ